MLHRLLLSSSLLMRTQKKMVNFTRFFQNLRSRIRRIHVAGRPVPNTVDLTRLGTELKLRLAAQSALQLEERFRDDGRLHVDQVLLKARSHYNMANGNNKIF